VVRRSLNLVRGAALFVHYTNHYCLSIPKWGRKGEKTSAGGQILAGMDSANR
jgi:hypothetical protein